HTRFSRDWSSDVCSSDLASARFATRDAKEADVVRRLSGLISNELNVKQVEVLEGAADVVEYKLNPLPSILGKKFGKDFPRVQKRSEERRVGKEWVSRCAQ